MLTLDVLAPEAGLVAGIDNLQIAHIARLAGAPKVQGAGVDLLCKLGDTVAAGDVLYRVYASYAADLEFARQASVRASGYSIGSAEQLPHVFVEF
ncbi:putative thymidine phosphorylase [compost metagenome]